MVVSYKWLLEYLPVELPVEELSEILTSIGLEVEALEPAEAIKGSLKGLVIGEVLTCEKHPNADKLKITTVNIGGDEPLNIVCGAPNVAAGQKVVVAPVGSTVHPLNGDAFPIKKAKIRGEASQGMICAEDEISLGESHDGIMILPDDAKVGMLAAEYFDIPEADIAIHIGLTPNRSDAMSHIGVAKDVAAYLAYHREGTFETRLPEISMPAKKGDEHVIAINVKNVEACPRYMGVTISDVKVAPSPDWLKQKLQAIGARPINNIVDITNYVLHEWGQPLHAFDADKIKGGTVNVGFLEKDAKFVTLDEQERKLKDSDLMICDEKDGMCIAGVFGGMHSGVSDDTVNVFLESAYFDPMHIRRTSLHHGLRTDAATHFEKGVDINNLEPALKRAAQLIVDIAGGRVASDITDVYEKKLEPVSIDVKYSYINKLSGKVYEKEKVERLLVALGFTITEETNEGLTVTVPTNKQDVLQPADIVEEVLRIDGLDNIPIPEKLNISLNRPMPNDRSEKNKIASILVGLGFKEIVTNSIVNSKYYPDNNNLVKMLNSLTSELDVLRPSMLESGLEVVQYNCNRKNNNLAFYEFGKVYATSEKGYHESEQLALYLTGDTQTQGWNAKEKKSDIYYLKGIINDLLQQFGISKEKYKYDDAGLEISWKKQPLCGIEEVGGEKLKQFDIKQPVYFAAINWDVWLKAAAAKDVKYKEVPKYPSVQRDLAIVIDKAVTYKQVQDATNKLQFDSLQEYSLFDVFESEKLGAGKKSFALNYIFQLQDRTLTDEETDKMMQQLMNTYKKELQAQIRE